MILAHLRFSVLHQKCADTDFSLQIQSVVQPLARIPARLKDRCGAPGFAEDGYRRGRSSRRVVPRACGGAWVRVSRVRRVRRAACAVYLFAHMRSVMFCALFAAQESWSETADLK
jgi:hypothetical protein